VNSVLKNYFGDLIKMDFDKIDYWNLLEQSQSMNQQKTNICEIRFYLRIERFSIQIFLHNQILIILEQGTKQYTISNQTYVNTNIC